jgi:hypothetical protein
MGCFEWAAFIVAPLASLTTFAASAEECTQPSTPIETDRPDTTNSAIVVPLGSLQNENGINISRQNGADIFDGSNSRWRFGIAPCLEVLIDLPNYTGTLHSIGSSGFGDVTPAVKLQVSPIPEKFRPLDRGRSGVTDCRRHDCRPGACNRTCNFRGLSTLVAVGP